LSVRSPTLEPRHNVFAQIALARFSFAGSREALAAVFSVAANRDLSKGLRDNLEETKNQIARLDQVFKKLGQEPEGIGWKGPKAAVQAIKDAAKSSGKDDK
jgi:ferritin-like metal-binding protein YciE